MLTHNTKIAAAVGVILTSCTSHAADINWSGFISIAAGKTISSDTGYNIGYAGLDGTTYDNDLSFAPDSIAALQGQIFISDKLRATVQLTGRGGDDFDLNAEWAYISYAASEDLTVSVGKFRLPLYYYSDFLDVGYTYYWVRPPSELYTGPSAITGINTYYSKYFGDVEVTSQLWYGTGQFSDNGTEINLNKNWGVNFLIGYDWIKFRSVYHETEIEVVPAAYKYDLTQIGYAIIADYQNFKWRSEYNKVKPEGSDFKNSWYMSAGYTFNKLTPHITYASSTPEPASASRPKADIMTYGVAYGLSPNSVLKFDYQVIDPDDAEQFKLVTAAIDIIF